MSDVYKELLEFIDQHGREVDENFPATALDEKDVLAFLDLLHANRVRPLGIELWRNSIKGYVVDGPMGWYAEGADVDANYMDAVEYMRSSWRRPDDLFVVQF